MDLVERFADQGCLRIERLFDPALIAAIHDEYQRQFAGKEADDFPPHLRVGDRRIQVPIELKGPLLDPLLTAHPLLTRLIETLIGPDPLIDSLVCVVALPGAADQQLHQDHPELFPDAAAPAHGLSPYAATVAVPLIDLTPETGTTRLFPGSHRLGSGAGGEPPPLGEGEPAYVERGGAYVMDYRLWHQGTANRSAQPRPVLYIVYARPWFTDIRNFRHHARVRLAEADARALPPHQRRLFRRLAAKGAFDLTEKELLRES